MRAILIIVIGCIITSKCGAMSKDSHSISLSDIYLTKEAITSAGIIEGEEFIVSDTLDLRGGRLLIPKEVTLIIRGGLIKNGVLIGQNTRIECGNRVFDNVRIEGSWIVPCIMSSMFCNLSYYNSLRDVIALSNPSINNTIIIEEGDFFLQLEKNADTGIVIQDNSKVIVNGNIHLIANDFPNYSIIKAKGKNISIEGNGKIIGDRNNHFGKKGEWGMGLTISGNNVMVKGINIINCWGDCIYVTGRSTDVVIDKCYLEGSRRQGISIISADQLTIKNCIISNIGGIDPGYAIDIEPNENDLVGTVTIENVTCHNCSGGFTANGRSKNSKVDSVVIRNSLFKVKGKPAIISSTCNSIIVYNCEIIQEEGDKVIAFDHLNNLKVDNNIFFYSLPLFSKINKRIRGLFNYDSWPMIISECVNSSIENNIGI